MKKRGEGQIQIRINCPVKSFLPDTALKHQAIYVHYARQALPCLEKKSDFFRVRSSFE